jgi:uncharacterized metal-binding protein
MHRLEAIMPELPERKVGVVACSGEEIAEGTVSRLAALKVLHELRRGQTVTICLPLFLAGGKEDRTFAKFYPTITVDGCGLKCAAKGTETYSAKPAASVVVSELAAEHGIAGIEGRRCPNAAGMKAVEVTAERIAALVDEILGPRKASDVPKEDGTAAKADDSAPVGCSCGSGIPVKHLTIAGQAVEVVALPLIFDKLREAKRSPSDALTKDILEMVKIYNHVAPEVEASWREVLAREYAAHCQREESK